MKIIYLSGIFLIMLYLNSSAQDRERTLLIFGGPVDSGLVKQQLSMLQKHAAGVKERDIKVQVVKNGHSLRSRYTIADNPITVLLIGKDGGEKLRTLQLLPPEKLFAIIDAMPMRRQEIKKKEEPTKH